MDHSLKTGLSFGLTSAIITSLGLMVGLQLFSGSKSIPQLTERLNSIEAHDLTSLRKRLLTIEGGASGGGV